MADVSDYCGENQRKLVCKVNMEQSDPPYGTCFFACMYGSLCVRMCVCFLLSCACVSSVCGNMNTYYGLHIGLVLILGLKLCGFTGPIYNVFA